MPQTVQNQVLVLLIYFSLLPDHLDDFQIFLIVISTGSLKLVPNTVLLVSLLRDFTASSKKE